MGEAKSPGPGRSRGLALIRFASRLSCHECRLTWLSFDKRAFATLHFVGNARSHRRRCEMVAVSSLFCGKAMMNRRPQATWYAERCVCAWFWERVVLDRLSPSLYHLSRFTVVRCGNITSEDIQVCRRATTATSTFRLHHVVSDECRSLWTGSTTSHPFPRQEVSSSSSFRRDVC